MPIINFSIPETLERRVKKVTQKKGFPSKAELFRFAVMRYLDEVEVLPLDRNPRIVALADALESELIAKIGSTPLPPVEEQLERMKEL